ncbi:hypothetical protein LEP1GSC021_1398 [Leptospira noguchii str. 1993005606]|nr:hypothetical protein LEP1GSC021_1398 [Leptospira noguchii str. 1993005606]
MLPIDRNSGGRRKKFGRLFSIRKTYFLQVTKLTLVGTLEKCALILKCGVGYDS